MLAVVGAARARGALTGLALILIVGRARAAPQVGAALTVGAGAVGLEPGGRPVPVFHLGGRADVLFLRERDKDMAIGPYVELATEAFRSFEAGGGADWLVPVSDVFPFVISAGLAARSSPGLGWEPGLSTALFVGSRGYNFHSWYGLTGGVFVQARTSLGPSHDTDLVGGLEVDLSVFAYPFLLLYGALHH